MVSKKLGNNELENQDLTYGNEFLLRQFDGFNIKIVKELITNPDISSTEMAIKYKTPLSTIQRRRAKLEESVINKEYTLDVRKLGWRLADLLISVEKGKAEETAIKLLQGNRNNVIVASLRIGHPQVDIMAEVFYRNSQELHRLTEGVKSMPHVTYVEWAEVVKIVGSNVAGMLDKVLDHH